MMKSKKRYLFIGEFDSLLINIFSRRGDVILVNSVKEGLNQKGSFSLIIMDHGIYSDDISLDLSNHYPTSPLIVSNGDNVKELPTSARYVKFDEIISDQIGWQEKLALTELKVEMLRRAHIDSKKLLILIHDQPDPDCIASALALRALLRRNKQTATIGYLGDEISRPENVAMIELLNIELKVLSKEDLREYDSIAMVDVQPTFFGSLVDEVDSVIDHHPRIGSYEAKFEEVSAEEGATSTIMTHFLRSAQIELSERLSTALLYGIKTDTVSLSRDANEDDVEAFTYLYSKSNLGLLRRIEKADIPTKEIKLFGQALAGHWIEEKVIFVNLGRVKREYLIPKMADLAMQVKNIEWSVVFGIVNNNQLVISLRNVGYVKSAGRLVVELFREIGSAGGHRSSAKAVISLSQVRKLIGNTSQASVNKWLTRVFKTAVHKRIEDGGG